MKDECCVPGCAAGHDEVLVGRPTPDGLESFRVCAGHLEEVRGRVLRGDVEGLAVEYVKG